MSHEERCLTTHDSRLTTSESVKLCADRAGRFHTHTSEETQ
jgi:hypothetical protein